MVIVCWLYVLFLCVVLYVGFLLILIFMLELDLLCGDGEGYV